MKKIIIGILIIIFLTFIIYKSNANNLIDYMSIGDSFDIGINSYGNNTYSYRDYLKNYLNNKGELWLVVRRDKGADSMVRDMKKNYSQVEIVERKKGFFIIKAER